MDTLKLLVSQILIVQDHSLTSNLPHAFVFFLKEILCHKKSKNSVVSRSSMESEYHVMVNVNFELVWITDLSKFDFLPECPMMLYCNNEVAIQIAENSVFHERTKHVEVNCSLVRQKIEEKIVQTRHISFDHQLANQLTKFLEKICVDFIYDKLTMYDQYTPA